MKSYTFKIEPADFGDIIIIGINSNLADYKLAWFVNNKLSFNFVREKDIVKNGAQYAFYLYNSDIEGNGIVYNLVSLKYKGKYWLNVTPRIDFLLIIRTDIQVAKLNEMLTKLREISGIGHVWEISDTSDNSLAVLLEAIETHEVNVLDEKDSKKDLKILKEEITKQEELRRAMLTQQY